jgi:hypothetical protein
VCLSFVRQKEKTNGGWSVRLPLHMSVIESLSLSLSENSRKNKKEKVSLLLHFTTLSSDDFDTLDYISTASERTSAMTMMKIK